MNFSPLFTQTYTKIKKSTLLAAVVFSLFFMTSVASAAEMPTGFSVEPAMSHISVAPGTMFRSAFTIRNSGKTSISVKLRVANFEPSETTGGVKEVHGMTERDDPIYAAGWVSHANEILVIPPGRKLLVPYAILVPSDASPGGRSIVFVVESTLGSVRSRIYAPCFLSVPGEVREELVIENFSLSPIIHTTPDGIFRVSVFNSGKTHIRPEAEVRIVNMFGVERGRFTLNNSDAIGTIIPGARRTVEYRWSGEMGMFDFGLWNARLRLSYGVEGERTTADRTFFAILPVFSIVWAILILGGSLYLFVRSVKKLRMEIALGWKKEETAHFEREVSLKLLLIPFLAGLLLLIVITVTLFSLFSSHKEGSFHRDVPLSVGA